MGYDLIGDIHGEADQLHALLKKLGYIHTGGAYRCPGRQAIFLGDYIDRGPGQLETVNTVRAMVDAGQALALLGNHEFNAIAWHMQDPDHPGETLRPQSGTLGQKNRHQHREFLNAVESQPRLHQDIVDWFLTLPLWLDLPGLRAVHACWHPAHMAALQPWLGPSQQLTVPGVIAASRASSTAYAAIECLTKGPEIDLPNGLSFTDKDGHIRHRMRVCWWRNGPRTYRGMAHLPRHLLDPLPDAEIPTDVDLPVAPSDKPLLFGHYWLTGDPSPISSHIACLDYSAAKGGKLVAYRWDGERECYKSHMVY